jgi:hypothetical protein
MASGAEAAAGTESVSETGATSGAGTAAAAGIASGAGAAGAAGTACGEGSTVDAGAAAGTGTAGGVSGLGTTGAAGASLASDQVFAGSFPDSSCEALAWTVVAVTAGRRMTDAAKPTVRIGIVHREAMV